MRRWTIVVTLAFAALPCWAAKRVSVEQLERTLAALVHRTDAETARQIGILEPAERISGATLERLTRQYGKGPLTSVALQLLADRSSFLDLPPSELPAVPPPNTAAQRRQLEAAETFAAETLPRLPNLFATRTIYSFDDSLQEVKKGGWLEEAGLHLVETSKAEVSVRSEQGNLPAVSRPSSQQDGLVTWGEFGSALLLILSDSAHGTTAWSHWEQSEGGLVSVFHYDVPQSASHYEIGAPSDQVRHLGGSGRWMGYGGDLSNDRSAPQMVVIRPGYHGSLWIDPGSGTILRISLIADVKGSSNLEHAAILVDYGPVRIAGKTFVCPVRSLALSDAPANVKTTLNGATTEWLNENLFTNYHLFHASSQIVGEGAGGSEAATQLAEGNASPAAVASQPSQETAASAGPPSGPPVAPQPPAPEAEQHRAAANATGNSTPVLPPIEATPASPPVTPAPIEPAPPPGPSGANSAIPAPSPPPAEPSPALTFHVNVNAVLVPVVVRDDLGHVIGGLQRQDFEAFDDGQPRPLSGFLVEKRAVPRKSEQSDQGSAAPAAAPSTSAAAPSTPALPDRVTVFVFDDLHLTSEQIPYTQKAALRTLDEALAGSDAAAVVTTSGNLNSGLTRDRSKLSTAIMAVRPQALGRAETSSCPKISYYQADLIVNKHNDAALQDAIQQVMTVCSGPLPPQMLPMATSIANSTARQVLRAGEEDVLTTYATLSELVRRMARLPGQHTMILVSPGFLPIEEEARSQESRLINLAADSSVTINALDARGLYTTAIPASENLGGRDPLKLMEYRENAMTGSGNAMGELAEATGGAFFHNSNDLAAGLGVLLEAPETVYVLELPLEGVKQNGAWHRLSVKVDRAGTHIQARQGYFAPAQSAKKTESHN